MKFSFAYVKQNPVMFGAIFIVFGLIVFLLLNKSADTGASSGGTSSFISTGPSDTEIASQAQLGMASIAANANTQAANFQLAAVQIQSNNELAAIQSTNQASLAAIAAQGNTDIALAGLAAKVALEETAAGRDVAIRQTDASLSAMMGQYATTLAMQMDNNATQLGVYRDANATSVENNRINAQLQAVMSAQQAEAYKASAVLSVIPTLKKKNRDDVLKILGPSILNQDATGGSSVMAIGGTVQAA